MNLFPKFTQEGTARAISHHWDLSGPFPLPKFELHCPICSRNHILLKECLFHVRGSVGSPNPFRCDVKFKCLDCSYVWQHGLVVPQKMAKKHTLNQIIHWRQLKKMIKTG